MSAQPPPQPQLSADGRWWWSGTDWIVAPSPPTPAADSGFNAAAAPAPASTGQQILSARPSSTRTRWCFSAAIAAGVAVAVVIAGLMLSHRGGVASVPFKQAGDAQGFEVTVVRFACPNSSADNLVGCNADMTATNVSAEPLQLSLADVVMTDTRGRRYSAEPYDSSATLVPGMTAQPGETLSFSYPDGQTNLNWFFRMTPDAVSDHLTIRGTNFDVPHDGPSTG